MKTILIFSFLIIFSVSLAISEEDKAPGMPAWKMSGTLVITDTCGINCPCLFGMDPHHGHCRFIGGMKVDEGVFGDVSLDGVTWGFLGEFTGSRETLSWVYTGYYIDNGASEEQQEALKAILSGAPFSTLGEQLGIKVVNVEVGVPEKSVGEYSLKLGDLGSMTVLPITGNDPEAPQSIKNPVYPFPVTEVIIGSAAGKFNDHGKKLDLNNNSGEISMVVLAGGGKAIE